MTSVCFVPGRTARRQSAKRSSISAACSRRTKSWSPITRNVGAGTERISSPVQPGQAWATGCTRSGNGGEAAGAGGLHRLEEGEEVVGVGRHRLAGGLPGRELLLGGESGIVLCRCRDLRVV